jgi:DNA-binding NarL/FixJ family response regulator
VASEIRDQARRAYHDAPPSTAEPVHVPLPDALSPRETQVLQRIAEGDTNQQIARVFQRSEETVKSHVKHVLEKLGASSRAHAVTIGFRQGLLR